MADGWIANTADGKTFVEEWLPGYTSPWQRLMEYCRKNHTYVSALRLTVGKQTFSCPSNAEGYWHAVGMPATQGIETDEELHKFRGIGWVAAGSNVVQIIWAARDPYTHDVIYWSDERQADNQQQIIWAIRQVVPLVDRMEIPRADADVKGLDAFHDKIIQAG